MTRWIFDNIEKKNLLRKSEMLEVDLWLQLRNFSSIFSKVDLSFLKCFILFFREGVTFLCHVFQVSPTPFAICVLTSWLLLIIRHILRTFSCIAIVQKWIVTYHKLRTSMSLMILPQNLLNFQKWRIGCQQYRRCFLSKPKFRPVYIRSESAIEKSIKGFSPNFLSA